MLDLYGLTAAGPVPVTLRGLAMRWKTSRGRARAILGTLAAAGLVQTEPTRSGAKRTGLLVSTSMPKSKPKSKPAPKQEPLLPARSLPGWARTAAGRGVQAGDLCDTVIGILGQITGREPNPSRAATAAGEVLKVWRKLERPPLNEFHEDFTLVARAARKCPDPLFARDIRGEGWAGARDRSQDVSTLCVLKKWDDRLRAAREWVKPAPDPAREPQPQPEDDGPLPSMFGDE